jgi:hypothetical protein
MVTRPAVEATRGPRAGQPGAVGCLGRLALREMAAATRASQFLNRNSEREHLDTLLADVHAGYGAALVLRGEAGVRDALPSR